MGSYASLSVRLFLQTWPKVTRKFISRKAYRSVTWKPNWASLWCLPGQWRGYLNLGGKCKSYVLFQSGLSTCNCLYRCNDNFPINLGLFKGGATSWRLKTHHFYNVRSPGDACTLATGSHECLFRKNGGKKNIAAQDCNCMSTQAADQVLYITPQWILNVSLVTFWWRAFTKKSNSFLLRSGKHKLP